MWRLYVKIRLTFSFIRQRNSYSRLSITRELFDGLMLHFDIFPRFREFVLLFGAKHGENEIGPPHMRFRMLVAHDTFLEGRCAGFGSVFLCQSLTSSDHCRVRLWTKIC